MIAPHDPSDSEEWLVLIHQIPPKPSYLRVKIGRRLARIGAVALKNSVYLLPMRDECQEDFQWVLRELRGQGGEASLLRAAFVEGLQGDEVKALFNVEREREYEELRQQIVILAARLDAETDDTENADNVTDTLDGEVARLERKLADVIQRDFFGATGRDVVESMLMDVRASLIPSSVPALALVHSPSSYAGLVWVTRSGVHVDRIASAWLIRRYIDAQATFKFVASKTYTAQPGEVCFDMFEAESTHEGNACTFEVLCSRFGLTDPGLSAVAEIIHDLDIKDERYNRPEAAGFLAQLQGITLLHQDDEQRIAHGSNLIEAFVAYFAAGKDRLV